MLWGGLESILIDPYTISSTEDFGAKTKQTYDATQQALEKVYYYMIKDVLMPKIKENGNNLVLTGGCSLNVLAVQMIQREFPNINVHVSRDPEDGGLSFGGVIDFMVSNDMVH